jgi:uncharacterized protein (TIGR02147 family)
MRAFARDIGVDPSQLSRILNKSSHLSLEKSNKVSKKIFKSKIERELFSTAVEYALTDDEDLREELQAKLKKLHRVEWQEQVLSNEQDKILTDLRAVLVLETLKLLSKESSSITEIARTSGLRQAEIKILLQKLTDAKLVKKDGNSYIVLHASLSTTDNISKKLIRGYHKQVIEKALGSIDGQPVTSRYLHSKTMCINSEDYDEFCREIHLFYNKISKLNNDLSKKKDKIYELSTQFFELNY